MNHLPDNLSSSLDSSPISQTGENMRNIILLLSVLSLSSCLQPGSSDNSPAAKSFVPDSSTPEPDDDGSSTPSIPTTVSEITSALHGKFILSDGSHSIEFQGSQIYYEGTVNSSKHIQRRVVSGQTIPRNWQCEWTADLIEVKDLGAGPRILISVSSTSAPSSQPDMIENCPYLSSTSFKVVFTSETCFTADFPLKTESLEFCHE